MAELTEKTLVEAVNDALYVEMERDGAIMVMGEDVGRAGGVFRATAGLLDRFGGYLPAAIAGYNAGPGRISQRWIDLGRRRGDALFCELVVYAETEDYVKKIHSARAAYRELDPRLAGRDQPAP